MAEVAVVRLSADRAPPLQCLQLLPLLAKPDRQTDPEGSGGIARQPSPALPSDRCPSSGRLAGVGRASVGRTTQRMRLLWPFLPKPNQFFDSPQDKQKQEYEQDAKILFVNYLNLNLDHW